MTGSVLFVELEKINLKKNKNCNNVFDWEVKQIMCKTCGCESTGKSIKYKCDCKEADCNCDSVIEFDKEPKATPYCCGVPMKRIK